MVPPLDFPTRELLNQEVEIDGTLYSVRSYEDCLVPHYRTGSDGKLHEVGCSKPVGLLVKKVIAE